MTYFKQNLIVYILGTLLILGYSYQGPETIGLIIVYATAGSILFSIGYFGMIAFLKWFEGEDNDGNHN